MEETQVFKSLGETWLQGFSIHKLMIACHQDEFRWHFHLNGSKYPSALQPCWERGLNIIWAHDSIKDVSSPLLLHHMSDLLSNSCLFSFHLSGIKLYRIIRSTNNYQLTSVLGFFLAYLWCFKHMQAIKVHFHGIWASGKFKMTFFASLFNWHSRRVKFLQEQKINLLPV